MRVLSFVSLFSSKPVSVFSFLTRDVQPPLRRKTHVPSRCAASNAFLRCELLLSNASDAEHSAVRVAGQLLDAAHAAERAAGPTAHSSTSILVEDSPCFFFDRVVVDLLSMARTIESVVERHATETRWNDRSSKSDAGNDTEFRVENEVQVAYDPSFEHELWHDGESQRVVFVLELPHPELSAHDAERLLRDDAAAARDDAD